MDAKTKEVARPLRLETLCLAKELSKCKYLDVALSMIEDAFNKELGATSDNSIIVEIMPEGEKPELTEFVNTTDKELLYPELMRLCLEDAKGLPKDKQEKIKYYLDAFMNEWQHSQSTTPEPQRQEQTASTIPTIHDTDKERLVFGNALQKQYMTLQNGCYKWILRKSLLAYMCGRLYCGDRIKEDDSDYSTEYIKGKTQMPAKEVKALFGDDVASNRYQIRTPPRDSWKIDELFKKNGASK